MAALSRVDQDTGCGGGEVRGCSRENVVVGGFSCELGRRRGMGGRLGGPELERVSIVVCVRACVRGVCVCACVRARARVCVVCVCAVSYTHLTLPTKIGV